MKRVAPSPSCTRNGRALSRSSRFLRALLDSAREGIVVVSEEGEIVFANHLAEEFWGYEPGKMTGLPAGRLFHQRIALAGWGQGSGGFSRPVQVEAVRGDGGTLPLEVKLGQLAFERQKFRVFTVNLLARKTEEELVQEQVRVFESLEVFASGLAHDLNNILTGVMGNLHLAMENATRRGRLEPALLEGAYSAALRARGMGRELFDLALGSAPNQGANALPQLVCQASLLSLAGSRVQVDYDFKPDLRAAFIDAGQIGQVVHQLLRFAAERAGDAGHLKVAAKNFRVEPGDSGFCGELLPGAYVLMSIAMPEDSIAAADCPRLFEPYRMPGSALAGLTLSICRCVVRRHGGLLRAVAGNGTGSPRLELYLPACRDVSNGAVALLRVDVPCLEGCHVLVMDDEELVRKVLKRSLEGMGHRVVAVADGDEAVAAYQEAKAQGDRFDVVFLDLRVPQGSGGKEACRELLELDPEATCVLISGSVGDEAMIDPSRHGFAENLEKPFDLHEVGRVMNRLLERMGRGDAAVDQAFEEAVALECSPSASNIVSVDFRDPLDRS